MSREGPRQEVFALIIREKVLLAIVATIVFLVVASFFIASYYIDLNHRALEEEITKVNTEQASFALERQSSEMSAMTKDWAMWNDTYDYLRGDKPDYVEMNIANSTFTILGVNSLVFVDAEGHVVHDMSYDLNNGTPMETPPDLLGLIHPGSPLLMNSPDRNLTGIVSLREGPMIIAAYPVLTGYGSGPPAGTLIMGEYVDSQFLTQMAGSANTSIILYEPDDPSTQEEYRVKDELPPAPEILVSPLSADRIAGYQRIDDVFGRPALVLKIETDRPIYRQGNLAMLYFTGCVALSGVILCGLIWFLLDTLIISRLSRLHESVQRIGLRKDTSGRVPVDGNDELTELARGINEMLATVEESQKKLEELNTKYRSVNEELETRVAARTAQAELYLDLMGHDISNLNQIALGYLEMAQERLELGEEDRELLARPVDALKNSTRLINNVRKLQRATEGRTSSRLLDVGELLSRARAEYAAMGGDQVAIRYQPVPGCLVQADELLVEVFSNLVGNAIKHAARPVNIDLGLRRCYDGGRNYYLVTVEDDGPGIPDATKAALFERLPAGSGKVSGRKGMGLYLVRSLVELYGGKVWVEDRVPGDWAKGSRFVVLLPVAEEPADS